MLMQRAAAITRASLISKDNLHLVISFLALQQVFALEL